MIGTRVSHYKIIEALGGGYKSFVYRARDLRLNRNVAIKCLRNHPTASRRRFLQEAKAIAAIDHPNVCTIYEADRLPDGRPFIVMAYYPGATLQTHLERGPLAPVLGANVALQIGLGLQKLRECGVVHGNLTPSNAIVTLDRTVKLIDFDVCRFDGEAATEPKGMALGTPAYMSPEQMRGATRDHRSDIWSLAVILHEMLTGRALFGREDAQATMEAVMKAAPKLPALGSLAPFDRIFARAFAKPLRDRYQDAAELVLDLHGVLRKLVG